MEDIIVLNKNDFGLAFRWKRCSIDYRKKINFVFDRNAIHLNEPEVLIFNDLIDKSLCKRLQNINSYCIGDLVFVETPMPQLSLILDYESLVQLQNLVEGTLLELGIDVPCKSNKNIQI